MKNWTRFIVVALLAITATAYFWLESRYPDLNNKALMATSGTVGDTLSVWPKFKAQVDDPLVTKILYSTVNWAFDNRRGMLFGVFLSSIFLTLVGYVQLRSSKSSFKDAVMGVLIGTPLGVCVNCAAPVFKGMLQSRRLETAFAAMLSSPTLNIIVLTMVFSLFPLYMAVTKVIFTLVSACVIVPLLAKILGRELRDYERPAAAAGSFGAPPPAPEIPAAEGLWAIPRALQDLGRNFFYIVIRTVPLMLVAGFLGAALSHLVPLSWFNNPIGFMGLVVAAFCGVFLPTPMAFDVMLTHALYEHGLPADITLALLCTLGIFSIYSLLITWQSASPRWALSLYAWFWTGGISVGVAAPVLHRYLYVGPNVRAFQSLIGEKKGVADPDSAIDLSQISPPPSPMSAAAAALPFTNLRETDTYQLESRTLLPRPPAQRLGFVKKEGYELGLGLGFRYSIRDYPDPFWIGRGTAAADFDGDGWVDLAFGSSQGPLLYRNQGGWFSPIERSDPSLQNLLVYAVAFVDWDNDGALDLFFTTFQQGNFWVKNVGGQFDLASRTPLANYHAVLTVSPAFGDLNRDGYLDVVNGNMALGVITGSHEFGEGRLNSVLWGAAGGTASKEHPLMGDSGETMSTLIADLNNDQRPDIYLAQDFVIPDQVLLGQDNSFALVNRQDKVLTQTPVFSMGADTGDVNNDLIADLLITGTTMRMNPRRNEDVDGVTMQAYAKPKWGPEICLGIQDPISRNNCQVNRQANYLAPFYRNKNLHVDDCRHITNTVDRHSCLLSTMWLLVTHDELAKNCEQTFGFDKLLLEVCATLSRRGRALEQASFPLGIPQRDEAVLYLGDAKGGLSDINTVAGAKVFAHPGGWTWNARLVDLDQDGWQDVFNADGAIRENDWGTNVYLHNEGGKSFVERQYSHNLSDDFNLFSFAVLDYDRDGDVDIIGNSSIGPVQIYENQTQGEGFIVNLKDAKGNYFGIGAKVYITYDGGQQVREVKASGGYQSFDPPLAHFGLGTVKEVKSLRVRWPDGAETEIAGPLAAGQEYRISRR